MMIDQTTRREFLKHSTETAAILTAAATLGRVQTFGAEKPAAIRLGIIGCGGIMSHHMKGIVSRQTAGLDRVAVQELVYLMGGESRDVDVADFPELGKRMFRHPKGVEIFELGDAAPFGPAGE